MIQTLALIAYGLFSVSLFMISVWLMATLLIRGFVGIRNWSRRRR